MEKVSNILTKVVAIALMVVGALALAGNVYLIIEGAFSVKGIIMALVLLAAGIVVDKFAKKGNALHFLIVMAIVFVLILVDRFAIGGWSLSTILFGLLSVDLMIILGDIIGIIMILLAVAAAAVAVIKLIPMIKK